MAMDTSVVRQKRLLVDAVKKLSSTEHNEVFKLLKARGVQYTENGNGVWCDLHAVHHAIIDDVCKLVEFYSSNKQQLDEFEQRMADAKIKNRLFFDVHGGTVFDMPIHRDGEEDADALDAMLSNYDRQAKKAVMAPSAPAGPTSATPAAAKKKNTTVRYMLAKKRFGKRSAAARAVDVNDELLSDQITS